MGRPKNEEVHFKYSQHKLTKVFRRLREKGMTLKEIGEKYGYSYEGVRQIERGYQRVDIRKTFEENEGKIIEKADLPTLMSMVLPLTTRSRDLLLVLKREAIIIQLRDRFGYSFTKIAKIMNRDHSSIMHLYYRNYDQRQQSLRTQEQDSGEREN